MAITDIIEESEMIETGAPSIKYEGDRPLKKQEMLMAGPDWYLKRMQLLMDEYGYDYDEAGEIAYDSDKYYEVIGIDPGGMGDESRNMDQEVVEEGIMRTAAANGGPAHRIQLVKRNKDGSRPGYYGADYGHSYDPGHADTKASKDYRASVDKWQDQGSDPQQNATWEQAKKGVDAGIARRNKEEAERKAKEQKEQKDKDDAMKVEQKVQIEKQQKKKDKFGLEKWKEDWGKEDDENYGFDKFDKNKDGKLSWGEKREKAKLERMQKSSFDKYQQLEPFVGFDDYGSKLSGEDLATKQGFTKNPDGSYSYDRNFFRDDKGNIKDEFLKTDSLGNQYIDTGVGGYDFRGRDSFYKDGKLQNTYGLGNPTLTSNRGTSIEKTRPNEYPLQSKTGTAWDIVGQILNPDDQIGAFNTLQDARTIGEFASRFKGGDDTAYDEFIEYKDRLKTPGGGGGGEQDPCKGPNPPAYCFVGGKNQKDEEVEEEEWYMPLAFRAEGGRVGRAFGGIMGDDGRRAYGLGSIFKKVKKVFKSPLGKMALLGGLGMLTGGAGASSFMGKLKGNNFLKSMLLKDGAGAWSMKNLSPWKAIGGISALSGLMAAKNYKKYDDWGDNDDGTSLGDLDQYRNYYQSPRAFRAEGGDAESGLMDMGGMEKDYREEGGFVPIGGKEKADDVPARLSKNEFVFTADAVRGAGEGDIDKGAEVMYNMMKNLEAGGEVSEESQGLDGAREMFQTSQRLEEVL